MLATQATLGGDYGLDLAGDEAVDHLTADDDASILIDFDPAEGDQGQRRAIVEGAGDEVELQLCAFDLPEIYGWSVSIEYDPDPVRYLRNSFEASTFVP